MIDGISLRFRFDRPFERPFRNQFSELAPRLQHSVQKIPSNGMQNLPVSLLKFPGLQYYLKTKLKKKETKGASARFWSPISHPCELGMTSSGYPFRTCNAPCRIGNRQRERERKKKHSDCVQLGKGALKKIYTNSHKIKKGGRKRQCPALCEICLRPSAISADVTHAVGVADLAPGTERAEARLFAPFAVVVAVLAPEARLFAPFEQLKFSFDFEFELTLVRCSSFMLAHG